PRTIPFAASPLHRHVRCDQDAVSSTEHLALGEKAVFDLVDRVRLHLDDTPFRQRKDLIKTGNRLERRQREEVIDKPVASRQDPIHDAPVKEVPKTFLAAME